MNSITRPLGIDSTKLAVTSILSKKVAAGSTHVVVDIPYGPGTKVSRESEAKELAALFEAVGSGVGLTVAAVPTDASRPIGRGIGPALEVRDVWWVLGNAPDAPVDLREKALDFAGIILNWDPSVTDGRARARVLLESGAALQRMERIVDLQGRKKTPIGPGALSHDVLSTRSGEVTSIDCYRVASIARQAGAPMDKGAGIDFIASVGSPVEAGKPLYRILANVETDFRRAIAAAEQESGIQIR
jgi:thymidine phosphorylase